MAKAKSAIQAAIDARKASKATGGRAGVLGAAARTAKRATKQGTSAGYSFKGSGRSAAYRGAASKALRGGGNTISAHRAGNKAHQAYVGA